VDEALASDPALQQTFEHLRSMLGQCDSTLAKLDQLDFDQPGLRIDRQAAVDQRAAEIIRQWMARPRMAAPTRLRKAGAAPLWSYPFAAAAAILLGFLIYWGRAPNTTIVVQGDIANQPTTQTAPDDDLATFFPPKTPGTDILQQFAMADEFDQVQSRDQSLVDSPLIPDPSAPLGVNP
jgi:hypothetical protein